MSYKLDYINDGKTLRPETWNRPSTKVPLCWTLVILDIFVMQPFDVGPLLTSGLPQCGITTTLTSSDPIPPKLTTYNRQPKDYKA